MRWLSIDKCAFAPRSRRSTTALDFDCQIAIDVQTRNPIGRASDPSPRLTRARALGPLRRISKYLRFSRR